jgi:thioredoxin 1
MFDENELEKIKLRKIEAMLNATVKGQVQSGNKPIVLTDNNFSATVTANELLVVDFWAPWCGPCRMVGPIIEQLANEYAGKAAFGKMNVDENQVVASNYGIMSIPTIVVFHRGQAVETVIGAYPKQHIEAVFRRYMPPQ